MLDTVALLVICKNAPPELMYWMGMEMRLDETALVVVCATMLKVLVLVSLVSLELGANTKQLCSKFVRQCT